MSEAEAAVRRVLDEYEVMQWADLPTAIEEVPASGSGDLVAALVAAVRAQDMHCCPKAVITPAVAVQLHEEADWDDLIEPFGGEYVTREVGDTGEYESSVRLPDGREAHTWDWLVLHQDGRVEIAGQWRDVDVQPAVRGEVDEPVAFRVVRTLRDGTRAVNLKTTRDAAGEAAEAFGGRVEPLYARPVPRVDADGLERAAESLIQLGGRKRIESARELAAEVLRAAGMVEIGAVLRSNT